ncbi:MAG: hypothetical protein ACLS48_07340 [[Eubacterium] siraeum]
MPLEALPVKAEHISQAKEAIEKVGLSVVRINVRQNFRAVCVREYRFARTLVQLWHGRELMLLDEPFSALDSLTDLYAGLAYRA